MKVETLRKCRKRLQKCLAAEHIETNACLKKCLIETIAEIDKAIKENDQKLNTDEVLSMVGKILNMMSRITSLFGDLK